MSEELDKNHSNFDFNNMFMNKNISNFSALTKLVLQDLNSFHFSRAAIASNKDQINKYLKNPELNAKQIRDAVIYIYNSSSHFRRIIKYFVGLNDFAYVVSPYNLDFNKSDKASVYKKYQKTMQLLSSADIKNQFPQILTVCFREDTFYGYLKDDGGVITLMRLPSDYCNITSIEDNVFNISFDFSYFDYNDLLENYPFEFKVKYSEYSKDKAKKWIELDSPNAFAVKCNTDFPTFPVPPFAGILRDIYDIEDYKQLKLSKTELENYAILVMKLGLKSDGTWAMDFQKAKEFWENLDGVLPEQIGSVLSPMEIEKIDFENSGTSESDKIAESESHMFSSAGVSSQLFNGEATSSNALMASIKADQELTYEVVKSIEQVINRYLHHQIFGRNFKLTFINSSVYNRKELADLYIKGCQYGMPLVSMYCAVLGLDQNDMYGMNYLEEDILRINDRFKPLQSSNTISSDDAGRDSIDDAYLSDEGERTRDKQ